MPGRSGHSASYQVCLPYRGAFFWHVGHDDVFADPNRVVFVTADEAFRISRPLDQGYAELIVTVPHELLSEVMEVPAANLPMDRAFRDRSRPASPHLQRLGAALVYRSGEADVIADDEKLVAFVRAAMHCPAPLSSASPSTMRLVARAKAYLAEHLSRPVRLQHIAQAAGTTPAYLTTLFRQLEGLPLHKYLVRLRLARALVELPQTSDLTRLAGDLGFASHSHFSSAFRRSFGCTPSEFRVASRPVRARVLAALDGSGQR